MKAIQFLVLSVLFLCFCSSCCYDKTCQSEVGLSIKLLDYPDDLYLIEIESFVKNSQFDSLIRKDSMTIYWGGKNAERLSFLGGSDFDYRCTLLKDSNVFTITNLVVDINASVRRCGLAKTKDLLVCPYESINVQGTKASYDDNTILLAK